MAWQAGFEIVFVDKKAALVDALRRQGRYTVTLYGRQCQEIVASGYRVYHWLERAAVAEEIRDARLVLTAVFDQNLPDVARTIALGIAASARARPPGAVNGIACENMMDSSTTLGRHVRSLLKDADFAWCEKYVGFPDCMISRVVPRPEGDLLAIVAEDYNEWTARRETFRGDKPAALGALELVDNQSARLERKLFIHNGGHAVCGYLGFHRGHRYIHEAVADPEVARHVIAALDELGEVVRRSWGFSPESIDQYKQDLCRRARARNARRDLPRGAQTRSANFRRAKDWWPPPLWPSRTVCRTWRSSEGSSRHCGIGIRKIRNRLSCPSGYRGKGWKKCWKTCAASQPELPWQQKSHKPGRGRQTEPLMFRENLNRATRDATFLACVPIKAHRRHTGRSIHTRSAVSVDHQTRFRRPKRAGCRVES